MNSEQKIGLAVFDTPAQQHAKTRTRFMILALICGGTMINYLDRSVMGIAAPSISADLGLNAAMMGLIFSAFSWTYAEIANMVTWIAGPECSFTTGFVFDLSGGRATY